MRVERSSLLKKQNTLLKRILLLGVFLLLGAHINMKVEAADSNDYKSNGSVGFYGEYVFPDKEKPNKPDEPNIPSPGNTSTNTSKPVRRLPQTGEKQASLWVLLIGILLIGVRTLFLIRKTEGESR
jgi:LPXTG-motif cell wall-anchored protein